MHAWGMLVAARHLVSGAALMHEPPCGWDLKPFVQAVQCKLCLGFVLCCVMRLMQGRVLRPHVTCTACREVWEFLSAWSELYGITTDPGFLRSMSQKIQGANHSVRRSAAAVRHLPCVGHSSCYA